MEQRLYQLWFKLLYPTGTMNSSAILHTFGGNALSLYEADADIYHRYGFSEKDIKKLSDKDLTHAKDLLSFCMQSGVLLLWYTDSCYPQGFFSLCDHPSLLFALGDVSVLNRSGICIVGSRSASARGSSVAAKLTQQAVSSGFIPVTGAATGIDSIVLHTAATLHSPAISVAAAGLDVIYPADVATTRQKLCAAGGVVLSEFLFGTQARSHHFPIRNRLLPALSQGVFVAEAGLKSGALLTANFAKEQHKPLFAVPGYIDDSNFSGCNRLIQQGATLVSDIAEAIDSLGTPKKTVSSMPTPPLPVSPATIKEKKPIPKISHPVLEKICASLEDKNLSAEEIILKTNLSAADVSAALMLGCLKDVLDKTADDRYFIK